MNSIITQELAKKEIAFLENEPLKNHTSFKIGGPADVLAMPDSVEKLSDLILLCQENKVPYFVLGRGSNLLVRDGGVDGVVIKLTGLHDIVVDGHTITAGAGAALSAVANAAKLAGLAGLEFASGIPGTLGGALYMNGGAYGGEMSQVVVSCRYMKADGTIITLTKDAMELSYRHSAFMDFNGIILEATMNLEPGDPKEIAARMDDYNSRRRDKQPLNFPSAGSFFKRPTGFFAGGLIEGCGLKGLSVGDAAVSEKHAGFLINQGEATCQDVLELMKRVQDIVYERKGVRLEPEVRIIGR